ncbi:MAG: 16S rRNA (guanine(966)-N(2))-methyltransferase RsmD [Firmicutes bacterium]|jgi:16S rRNA (guanine(966)-N(2))-methyltransferase RsmD|nr:16S rRNA (guanine(966)-N(2))-methyltransferase RsmD [Bacillota bacterium]
MRIIGGSCRGIRIKAPRRKEVRPTPDMVREALFDILGERVRGQNFVDIFAGSGAVGIEALSRGAKSCTFIENNFMCVKIIIENLKNAGLDSRASILRTDVLAAIKVISKKKGDMPFVYLDPPYNSNLIPKVLNAISSSNPLPPGGMVIVEHHKRKNIYAENWVMIDRKYYGDTALSFLKMKDSERGY